MGIQGRRKLIPAWGTRRRGQWSQSLTAGLDLDMQRRGKAGGAVTGLRKHVAWWLTARGRFFLGNRSREREWMESPVSNVS